MLLRFVLLAAMTALVACSGMRARENIQDGLLTLDLPQDEFLDVWGKPTHTSALSGDEIIKAGIAGWGGFFFKGRQMYEKWDYQDKHTELVFYERKLVAWRTSETVQGLSSPSKPEHFWIH